MVRDCLEEFEVEDVETLGVVLRDLHLLQERFAQYGHWYGVHSLEQVNEVAEHHFTDLDFPVKLDQDESQSLVNGGRCWVSLLSELL